MSSYWKRIEAEWDEINIYDGPEIFLETFKRAPLKSGLLYAAHFSQSEICNGGFHQFFFNSTGVLAPEAIRGFRAIGQNQIADLIDSAMRKFGDEYPRARGRRQALLMALGKDAFDKLDERFFALIHAETGGFDAASDAFASSLT